MGRPIFALLGRDSAIVFPLRWTCKAVSADFFMGPETGTVLYMGTDKADPKWPTVPSTCLIQIKASIKYL